MHGYCSFAFNILVFFFSLLLSVPSHFHLTLSFSHLAIICYVGSDLKGFGFWILVWCYNGGFGGLVWCFNGVSEVMVVVVVVVFGVYGWLVWWSWCVSLVVEDGDRDGVMEEIIIFNIICRYILYYFNELFIKIETWMLEML